MSDPRSRALANAGAAYLRQWWPSVERTEPGVNGSDFTGTPGIVWELKTAREFKPLAQVRQVQRHAANLEVDGMPPVRSVCLYVPRLVGAGSAADWLAFMPLAQCCDLMWQAGWAPQSPRLTGAVET